MSLKVWLPLCGDLKQQGISDITATTFETPVYVDGKIGQCYQRANSNSQLTNGINLNNNLLDILGTQASIAVWIKPLGTHTHYNGTIASSGNWNAKKWAFGVSQDNTKVDVLCGSYNNYINCNIPVNEWTHLVSTFDNGTCKLYKNGEYIGQLTGQKAFETDAQNACIARETYAGGYFGFNGCINDVRIYDHCLSAAEVHEISQGLVLHYKLDDISHGIVDSSGYSHNGIMTNNITFTNNTPRYSNATFLNKVRINSASGFPSGENPVFTVCFWTKILSTITYVSYGDLIGFYDKDQGNNTFRLELCGSPASNNLMWFRGPSGRNGGGFNMNSSSSSGWFSKDTWHHIALVGDGINKKYYCYLDGKLCGSYNGSANTWEPTGQWYLSDTTEATAYFSDVRIYCTALSADDIFTLYHTSAKVDNKQNLHSFEFIEDQSKISITKRGQTTSDKFNEITSTKFKKDTTIETAQLIEF